MVSKRARASNTLGTRLNAIQEGMAAIEAKTRTPADDGSTGRLEVIERTLELLGSANYRADHDLLVRGSDYAVALLDPAYRGPGPARVSFFAADGTLGALTTETYPWRSDDYLPWRSRVVEMIRISGVWYIQGHSGRDGYGGKVRLATASNWVHYNDWNVSTYYTEPRAQRLSSGIVVLSGLLSPVAAPPSSTNPIAYLPVGYRPDRDTQFGVLVGSSIVLLTVKANGDIMTGGLWPNAFLTLDGIAFPAAGVATWTDIGTGGSAYANSWANSTSEAVAQGNAAYWKDPYGVVWFRGCVKPGSVAADNTLMFSLPADHRTTFQSHVLTGAVSGSGEGFGFVSAIAATGVAYKTGTAVTNGYIPLAKLTIVTAECIANNPWVAGRFINNWINYATFPTLKFLRRADGLGMSEGLISSGTVNAKITQVEDRLLPDKTAILPTVSGAGTGRLDLSGFRETADSKNPGTWWGNIVANSWVAFDGLKWMVGD